MTGTVSQGRVQSHGELGEKTGLLRKCPETPWTARYPRDHTSGVAAAQTVWPHSWDAATRAYDGAVGFAGTEQEN
jgi:hypothetical protein